MWFHMTLMSSLKNFRCIFKKYATFPAGEIFKDTAILRLHERFKFRQTVFPLKIMYENSKEFYTFVG